VFFVRYNEWRQHQALGEQTPASVYVGSYIEQSYLGTTPEARLEDQEKPRQTDHKSGPAVPSRADLCLVSEEVPSIGGPVGTHCGLL
jgi:hypothetical protein